MHSDLSNFGTLVICEVEGLPFITDVATRKRLYRLRQCLICGMVPWSFTACDDDTCYQCKPERRERNDNEEFDGHG